MAILTGTRQDESGMISGLNSTGHEIGGTLGIAIFSTIAAGASGAILGPQAASGIGDAFLIAALIASLASLVALAVLPRAQHFLAKLRAQPAGDAGPLNRWRRRQTQAKASAPKRRADAERSIAAITNAALEALASDPDASMAEIARRAGVVRATIYMHFPTREVAARRRHGRRNRAGRGGDPRTPSPTAASRRKRSSA